MELLSHTFMQRALIAALLSGLIAPAIGTYIVQRRLSLLGDGLGHVAIMGVGLAFMTNTAPLPAAIAVCVAGAVAVELLRQQGKATGDVGLAILFYGGLASGVMMAGVAGQGAGALSQFLFGALTTVSTQDLWIIAGLATVCLLITIGLSPYLFAVTVDEDYARVLGLATRTLNLLIVVLAAVAVTVSMRTVGLLLVSAMMVIPVATAQNLLAGFRAVLIGSMVIGSLTAVAGTGASYYLNSASGATIVVLSILVFIVSWPLTSLVKERRFVAFIEDPYPEQRPHIIAEGQDPHQVHRRPVRILHGDHYDYVADGHRHARHGDHFDEH